MLFFHSAKTNILALIYCLYLLCFCVPPSDSQRFISLRHVADMLYYTSQSLAQSWTGTCKCSNLVHSNHNTHMCWLPFYISENNYSSYQPCDIGIFIPSLEIKKLRLRDVLWIISGRASPPMQYTNLTTVTFNC